MKKVLLSLVLLLASPPAHALPAQVLLLRHGEKPIQGNDLSPRGWARAAALPNLFKRAPFLAFGAPVVLYAQRPSDTGSQIRPFETLKFVAEGFRQAIDTDFVRDDPAGIAHEILQNPAYEGHLVVVCWEHKTLSDIASGLGVNPTPTYPDNRFDRAWLLTYSAPNAAPTFEDLPEHLLDGDTEQ